MAEIKFSELTAAAQLTNDDILALSQVQGGSLTSVKTSLIAVANFLNTQVQYTTAYSTQAKTTSGAINELRQLISLIPQFAIEVVEELPTEDISDTTIYLVPAEDPEVGNYYEEYIHVNDAWELVGTTAVDLSAYYTKLEVDGLLATKASVTEVALKENKTDMPTDVRTIIKDCKTPKNATITNGITQFECIEENLVKGLKVTMNPIQSGSGDPSPTNIRPITGRTEASVTRNSKNLFNNTAETTTTQGITLNVNADGTITGQNNATGTAVLYIATVSLPNGNYILNGCPSGGGSNTYKLDISKDGTFYTDNGNGVSFTVTDQNPYLVRLVVYSGNGNGKVFKPMVRPASIADTNYEPYTAETHTHQYSDTIYGGNDDFVNGGATSAMKKINAKDYTWAKSETVIYCNFADVYSEVTPETPTGRKPLYCNILPYNNSSIIPIESIGYGGNPNNKNIVLYSSLFPDLASWNSYITDNDVEICYPLSTPTTISTSAEEITTVAGTNIISGTEPISECKYTELATVDDLRKIIGGQ